MKVSTNGIDVVNRWKKVERGKGKAVAAGSMRKHCSEFSLLMQTFLRHTGATQRGFERRK